MVRTWNGTGGREDINFKIWKGKSMSPENTFEITLLEVFMMFAMWIVSIILLWRIFDDEDWPGWLAIMPIFNLIVLGMIIARAGWWGLKNTLKEIILISVLTVACLIFIPTIVESSPTLSGFIILMPPSIIGGYLVSRKLGCHSYNLYIPASTLVFSIVAMIGIFVLLIVLSMKSLGANGLQELLSKDMPILRTVDAEYVVMILNMGIFILVLMSLTSLPSLFVCGVIGAYVGEKIRMRLSPSGPAGGYIDIHKPVPSKPLVDTRISGNSPLRFHAQDAAEGPGAGKKPPEKMTILEKLKA